jgi:diacylglycerol kinase family enzyme
MSGPIVQLFVNERAGAHTRTRSRALALAFERSGARVLVSDSIADRLTVDADADHVCAVGGDGTLRHVVDAVRKADHAVKVSVYPIGTVNLLAREYAYPRSPRAFARRVLGDRRRVHHGAMVGDTPLSVCGSVGPDALAVDALSPRLKRAIGRFAYVVAFLQVLLRWRRVAMILHHDGQATPCEAVYIAKGRFFAGGWSFAPHARLGDPLLHVVALGEATRRRFLAFAWAMLRGHKIDDLRGVTCFTCRELTITSDEPLPFQGDGDIIARLPVTVTLAAESVDFA